MFVQQLSSPLKLRCSIQIQKIKEGMPRGETRVAISTTDTFFYQRSISYIYHFKIHLWEIFVDQPTFIEKCYHKKHKQIYIAISSKKIKDNKLTYSINAGCFMPIKLMGTSIQIKVSFIQSMYHLPDLSPYMYYMFSWSLKMFFH